MGKKRKSAKSSPAKSTGRLDLETVRQAAAGQWVEILTRIGGLPADILDGRHHPCPKCGGEDRFRMVDVDAGAVLCNQCFSTRNGDGFAAVGWARGIPFVEALAEVAEFCGVRPADHGGGGNGQGGAKPAPDAHLQFRPWNEGTEVIAQLALRHKPGVTLDGVRAAGGRIARYRGQFTVLAFPVWGRLLDKAPPAGWVIVNTTGGPLPRKTQGGQVEWIHKPKLTYGSGPGLAGNLERLRQAAVVWKLEGLSDLLAWLSMPDAPADHAAVTNAMGCQERPARWMCDVIGLAGCGQGKQPEGRQVRVLHDCDLPGQRGALGWTEHGRRREGWAESIAATATEVRNVVLPFEVAEVRGKDFRDWRLAGGDFAGLREMADAAGAVQAAEQQPNEAVDDPDRLARLNLERYAARTGGRTVKFCWDSWWTWKNNRYVPTHEAEIRAKLHVSIKEEFNRLNLAELETFRARKEAGQIDEGEQPPVCRKVTPQVVGAVVASTKSLCCVSGECELNTWLPTRESRRYLSMANGILDVEAAIANDDTPYFLPHSSDWFSCVHLGYPLDVDAECPRWLDFLHYNLQDDQEVIDFLQEWVGYLLTPDTGEQMFLVMVGEGANGKSVFCAGVEAILGEQNCSAVPLELFGDRFSKTQTLGKLVNICGDVGEIDAVAEGQIKAFTSGNRMMFDRKCVAPVECRPTARLMIACNSLPHMRDRSKGFLRRMEPLPWLLEIPPEKRVKGMDKAAWWIEKGEVSGMFNWALMGLARLRRQGRFTDANRMRKAAKEYQLEMNPAKAFLLEVTERSPGVELRCDHLYGAYRVWMKEQGHVGILSASQFGHEVNRVFPGIERTRHRAEGDRSRFYAGLSYQQGALAAEEQQNAYWIPFAE